MEQTRKSATVAACLVTCLIHRTATLSVFRSPARRMSRRSISSAGCAKTATRMNESSCSPTDGVAGLLGQSKTIAPKVACSSRDQDSSRKVSSRLGVVTRTASQPASRNTYWRAARTGHVLQCPIAAGAAVLVLRKFWSPNHNLPLNRSVSLTGHFFDANGAFLT